jgi:hypothetical protein
MTRQPSRPSRRLYLILVGLTLLGLACTAFPTPAAENQLVFQGTVQSLTGEPAVDRLVVLFLDGKEVSRTVTRCGNAACSFGLGVPNLYGLAGSAPSDPGSARIDVGLVPEGESRAFPAAALPEETGRGQHIYVLQVLAGPQESLPAELRAERLGLLPDGSVVAIGGKPPASVTQTGSFDTRLLAALALALACCSSLLTIVAGVVLVFVLTRRGRSEAPGVNAQSH